MEVNNEEKSRHEGVRLYTNLSKRTNTNLFKGIIWDKQIRQFDIKRTKNRNNCVSTKPRLGQRLNSRLYEKYCSSQNFYYTKEIDNILCGIKSQENIKYTQNDLYIQEFENKEEMLKRFYHQKEYSKKIKLLSEYYKYHEDVPRLAMLPLSGIVHNYHDQKRRVNYIKITKMLNNGKIDSELVRNMDPNEDSDYSEGSIASSLISFLPSELKQTWGLSEQSKDFKMKKTEGFRDFNLQNSSVEKSNFNKNNLLQKHKYGNVFDFYHKKTEQNKLQSSEYFLGIIKNKYKNNGIKFKLIKRIKHKI